MFSQFFYVLKDKGLDVSMTEWLTFMDAIDKGLYHSDFSEFYYLGRTILVNRESDYDKYDVAFMEYFKNIRSDDNELPADVQKWLDKGQEMDTSKLNKDMYSFDQDKDADTVKRMFKERITEQTSEHNGGNYWIGTSGGSSFGHTGRNPGGIRVGGQSGQRTAFSVMGERKYQDFRHDKALNMRQFQVAFRRLRQFSARIDIPKTELDIPKTIDSTCNNGGYLKLEFDKPRKNTVKLLLLFDCGGTMYPFMEMCNNLFQSVNKANHFKDVKTYYFHNCIYSHVYKTAECEPKDWIRLEDLFKKCDKDYKVIIIGDAQMAPEELFDVNGNYRGPNEGMSGHEWNLLFRSKFKKCIWLNPRMTPGKVYFSWQESESELAKIYNMYPLTVDGLKEGITKLMAPK